MEGRALDSGSDLLIRLPAQPDNIAVIRAAVGERARELGANRRVVDDLRTVVSEACTNVVLHAYPEEVQQRPLEVSLRREQGRLQLVVRDEGEGVQSTGGDRPPGLRMGLLLAGAISSCFQLRSRRGKGTELTLQIPLQATT
jgi:anti-sigma regulatory factor (Ser/Thr protein kinase)